MHDDRPVQTLTESFIALSDEVQSLIDRKTILEHKLRYAHEQYQYLADKYAPAVSETSETLAKLQLPPDLQYPSPAATSTVPLPKRGQAGNSQHRIALLIREGRKAAQQLAAGMVDAIRDGDGLERMENPVSLGTDVSTSASTALEKDFTVEGKKGDLACPFSAEPNQDGSLARATERVDGPQDPARAAAATPPHGSADPICAAMRDEPAASSVPSKCPIRFLDKHSPEEIAHYVETHKHAIPRSHEVCVRRYQRNEEQIRKLDAKYGNLVSMVKDLSQLHKPMLPPSKEEQIAADRVSNKRVEDWTQTVVAGEPGPEEGPEEVPAVEEDRDSRFDRPMRDIRVGESPSRPWGISVPPAEATARREPSLPRPAQVDAALPPREPRPGGKCPFDHTKMFRGESRLEDSAGPAPAPAPAPASKQSPPSQPKQDGAPSSTPQPTFVTLPQMVSPAADKGERPQVVFNISGPVFIGYPMDQAIQFMKQYQGH